MHAASAKRLLASASLITASFITSLPAHAIYKCDADGKTSYSDSPCVGGQPMPTPIAPDGRDAYLASERAAREKSEVLRMRNERERRNVTEESARQRAEAGRLAHQKKCKLLAMKKKWSEEDAASATLKQETKAKRKTRRQAEQYDLECGT